MSSNQLSKLNFLSTTERKFYKRKKPSHQQNFMNNSDTRLFSVIKGLNTSSSVRKIHHFQLIKTQQSEPRYSQDFTKTHDTQFFQQPQFIKKQLKAKLSLLFKKVSKKWKIMYENYQLLKNCPNLDTFNTQQNKFFTSMTDLLKQNIEQLEKLQKLQKSCKKQPTTQSKKEQKTLKINLQKIKLMKQNELLRRRCFQSTMKSPQNGKSIRRQSKIKLKQNSQQFQENNKKMDTFFELESNVRLKEQIKQLNQKIYEIENENFKLKENLVSTQDGLRVNREDRQFLIKRIAELKTSNQNLCAQVVNLKLQSENSQLKIERWRSILAFQRQEILSYQNELNSIKYEYKDLMRKYKNIAKKPNNPVLTNNNTYSSSSGFYAIRQNQQLMSKFNELFKEQIQSFHKIRSIFHKKQSQVTLNKTFGQGEKKNNKQSYQNYLSEKQTIANKNGIKKVSREYFAYFKPNFFTFVQGYMDSHGIDLINMEQISASFQLDCDFLATVRAILDSKFNDFLNENFTKTSSLPNFTYVWLSKYKIQRRQKKIVCIERDLDKSVLPRFFMNLMSEKLNSNWEIITFREFLMQSLTLDQLYFYLMARNFLFQGSLLQNISALYQQICFVSISDGLNLMQKFIPDINCRKRIQQYLKKYIIYVRKRPVIDAHFLLRILLEYYQAKKNQQFTNLNSLSDLLSKNKQSDAFSFESFMKIFDYNFTYLSMAQKLQIYKKSFSCSRGKISLQTILTVLTQQGYLCHEVRKIFCNDQILLKKDEVKEQNQMENLQTQFVQLANFQKMFQKFYKESFQPNKAQFGVYQMQRKFNSVKEFDQTTIFKRIQTIFHFCISTIRNMFFSKKISLKNFLPILQQITDILFRLNKVTCGKKEILELMTHFKRQNAAKKIIRFYRKKRNQMHRNFVLGIKDERKQEEEKINNLRNEFNSIIQNLKDKFPQKKEQVDSVENYEQQI